MLCSRPTIEPLRMAFWGGPLRERPILGSIDPGRATAITRAVVRQYFDQELLGKRDALKSAVAAFPEVTLRTVPAAGR